MHRNTTAAVEKCAWPRPPSSRSSNFHNRDVPPGGVRRGEWIVRLFRIKTRTKVTRGSRKQNCTVTRHHRHRLVPPILITFGNGQMRGVGNFRKNFLYVRYFTRVETRRVENGDRHASVARDVSVWTIESNVYSICVRLEYAIVVDKTCAFRDIALRKIESHHLFPQSSLSPPTSILSSMHDSNSNIEIALDE